MKRMDWVGLAVATALLMTPWASAQTSQAQIPVKDFFGPEAMSQPVMSPSGKHLAVRMVGAHGRYQLAVINLDPPRQAKVVAAFPDADVANARWVNDERLIFSIRDSLADRSGQRGSGLFAVDHTGEERRALGVDDPAVWNDFRVLRDGSADVILTRGNWDVSWRELMSVSPRRLNTTTGKIIPVDLALGKPAQWWVMDKSGVALAAGSYDGDQFTNHWRASASAPWEVVNTGTRYTNENSQLEFQWVGLDGQIYVVAGQEAADGTQALYRFDQTTRKREPQPMITLKGFDFSGRAIEDARTKKLIGVRYTSDATATVWFDEDMKALQTVVDQRRASTVNLLDPAECGCSPWVLVTSYSDRQPAQFSLLNRETRQLEPIGQTRPAVNPKQMAAQELERVQTRDGQSMPVYVTRPAGKGPWPAVVLVHGGPFLRGHRWGWSADAQFLASRGYVVMEPEFRGSLGYGRKWFRAGWKQWGLKMQDDVADATHWAAKQGLADPKRTCIAGASYGGYSTLMGLVRDPDLYKCGVAWAAVTDIDMMFDVNWSDFSDTWKRYGMPRLVGDPKKDAAQFEATSPLKQAARITQPLLLAHGGQDRRVPIVQGVRLRDAVQKTNPNVKWIEYVGEGHGWYKPENNYEFWTQVEQFLAQHLAAPK